MQLEEMPASTQVEFISENPQRTEVAEPLILSSTGMNILVSIEYPELNTRKYMKYMYDSELAISLHKCMYSVHTVQSINLFVVF